LKLRMVLLAALVAGSLSLPGTASARIVSVIWTCNSDGFEHVIATDHNGNTHEFISSRCGPIAFGGGFNLLLSERSRVSERGQTFLDGMEAGEAIPSTRVRDRDSGTVGDPGDLETIHLRSDEVGPRLAAFFTRIDRDWDGEPGPPAGGASIFDRWGNYSGGEVRVPGDVGIIIVFTGLEKNAKQICRDQDGFWRQGSAREWGCWTTAR